MSERSEALGAFANAELVRPFTLEEQNKDVSSDLFLGTAADIAQATTALLHSPHGGIGGPNKVTGTVHGAGRTLHLITSGATGHPESRVRTLIVLVLTAAVTLLVVDVLVPEAPGWVTTVGFSLLLGAIGSVALHFRQPLLGAVLLTMGLPLVIWSLTPAPNGAGDAQWLGPVITVAGVLVVMAIIGHVKEPTDPTVAPTEPSRAGWLGKALAGLLVLIAIGVGLYLLLAQALLGPLTSAVFITLAVVAVAAAVVGFMALRRMRTRRPAGRATVASWAFGLGLFYLVAAGGLLLYLGNTAGDSDQAGAAPAAESCTASTSTAPDGTILTVTSCSPTSSQPTPAQSARGQEDLTATAARYLPMTVSLVILGLAGTLLPVLLLVRGRTTARARPSEAPLGAGPKAPADLVTALDAEIPTATETNL